MARLGRRALGAACRARALASSLCPRFPILISPGVRESTRELDKSRTEEGLAAGERGSGAAGQRASRAAGQRGSWATCVLAGALGHCGTALQVEVLVKSRRGDEENGR